MPELRSHPTPRSKVMDRKPANGIASRVPAIALRKKPINVTVAVLIMLDLDNTTAQSIMLVIIYSQLC